MVNQLLINDIDNCDVSDVINFFPWTVALV